MNFHIWGRERRGWEDRKQHSCRHFSLQCTKTWASPIIRTLVEIVESDIKHCFWCTFSETNISLLFPFFLSHLTGAGSRTVFPRSKPSGCFARVSRWPASLAEPQPGSEGSISTSLHFLEPTNCTVTVQEATARAQDSTSVVTFVKCFRVVSLAPPNSCDKPPI